MSAFVKSMAALSLVLSLGFVSTPEAFAKAHDQGATQNASDQGKEKGGLDTPDTDPGGGDVGGKTVDGAQGLGSALGGGQGPDGTPGNSENAGRQ